MRSMRILTMAVALMGGAALFLSGGASAATPVVITSATALNGQAKISILDPERLDTDRHLYSYEARRWQRRRVLYRELRRRRHPHHGGYGFLSSTALQPGTYYVQIAAFQDDFLNIGWSDTATLVVQAPSPPAPAPPPPAPVLPPMAPATPPPAPVVTPATTYTYTFCLTTGKMLFGHPVFSEAARCRNVSAVRMGQVILVSTVGATDYPPLCFKTRTGSRCSLVLCDKDLQETTSTTASRLREEKPHPDEGVQGSAEAVAARPRADGSRVPLDLPRTAEDRLRDI